MKPLSGCRVLVTRPADQVGETVAALEAAGASVVAIPLIRIDPPDDLGPLREAARRLRAGEFDWVVVTSPNGAAALAQALEAEAHAAGEAAQVPLGGSGSSVRLCAVGPATAAALERAGLSVACVPERHEGSAVPEALERVEPLAGRRILLALGDRADGRLQEELVRRGARVERVTAYCTRNDPEAAARAAGLVSSRQVDLVVVASPSQVHALARALAAQTSGVHEPSSGAEEAELDRPVFAVAIGPTTARAAMEAGWQVTQAPSPTPQGLAEACVRAWEARKAG